MGESRAKKVLFAPQEGQKDGVPRQGQTRESKSSFDAAAMPQAEIQIFIPLEQKAFLTHWERGIVSFS